MSPTSSPSDAAAQLLQRGYESLRQGHFKDAKTAFSACLGLCPEEPRAWRGRGMSSFQLKEWPSAEADFKRARELAPDDPENGIGLGMSLAMQNDVYPAIDVLEKVIHESPTYVRARIQLGLLYFKLCLTAKGREQMEQALQLQPTLEERRWIEDELKKEKTLDQNRYYRPDFHALRNKSQ